MFKPKTIVLSIFTAFAVAGCASLEQFSDKAAHALGRPQSNHADMTAEQLYRLGKDYQAQVRYDQAIAAYIDALERDHTLADAHNALGVVYAQQGRYEYAISEFKAAIELKPGEAYLHNNLGYTLLMQGSNQQALRPLEIALQLEPANERAAFNLRLAHETLGDLDVQQAADKSAAATAAPPKPMAPIQEPAATSSRTSDPRLVAVAPGVYELRLPERTQPQIAVAKLPVVEETPLPPPPSQAQNARPYKLEVSNGNGAVGLARRVARLLDQNGIHANRITNHSNFREGNTQIEYRRGYRPEAERLREIFPAEVKVVASSALREDVQVRVLLGRDVGNMTILRQPTKHAMLTAQAHGAR